ncbi:DUF305 domain-containing protein [Pseudonocardia parietis]|uniref:Uncharacterized protein (DUF305 family) n=1 Tax=Pseudonocardia parietis TaxID=570936 RepID=A0ABS4W4X9_9PSEU|nr:DUF305 domain-containing protein [Pseudonocardia parietis]MBP2371277.1 uncharacterized protein (DUF305 family) [Pseudonocardia parietis]
MSTDLTGSSTPAPAAGRSPWRNPLVVTLAVLALAAVIVAGLAVRGVFGPYVPQPDSVDVGFAQDMSVHHRQAVEMASWARDHSTDPRVRQLAFDIETTQNRQAGIMQGWLGLWDAPTLPSDGHMAWMTAGMNHPGDDMASMNADGSISRMPGMATAEELARLRATPPPQLDAMFLQLMLRHHEGGTSMLRYGRDHADTSEVHNLASQMLTAQTAESQLMTSLLLERGAQPLPAN